MPANSPIENVDDEIIEQLAKYYDDPYGFVMWAFPWGEGELEGYEGPQDWQKDYLIEYGNEISGRNFDRKEAVPPLVLCLDSARNTQDEFAIRLIDESETGPLRAWSVHDYLKVVLSLASPGSREGS